VDASPPAFRLYTLGGPDLVGADGESVRAVLAQPKRLALLVYLVVAGLRAPVRRDRVLAMFWPEYDESRARAALNRALHYLRGALGEEAVVSVGAEALRVDPRRVWCDASALDVVEPGRGDEEVVTLYRAPFLDAFHLSDCPDFEQWGDGERASLARTFAAAALRHGQALIRDGRAGDAATLVARAARQAPHDEVVGRALVEALDLAGDRAGAAEAHASLVRRVREELGVEPSADTLAVGESLRRQERVEATPADHRATAPNLAPAAAASSSPLGADEPDASQAAGQRRWGRRAGALLILAAGAVALARAPWPTARGDDRVYAVFPFSYQGDSAYASLGIGVADLISTTLRASSWARGVDPRVVAAADIAPLAGTRPRDINAAVRRLKAGRFIVGNVAVSQGFVRLSAELHAPGRRWRAIDQASVSGALAELPDLTDRLTTLLLVSDTPPGGRLARAAAVTTSSAEALVAFADGERALREGVINAYDSPRLPAAVDAFERAAAADSTFALAHYRLGRTYVLAGEFVRAREQLAIAERLSSALPETYRLLIRAERTFLAGDARRSAQQYRAALRLSPDEIEGWVGLGMLLHWAHGWMGWSDSASFGAFREAMRLDPGWRQDLIHMAEQAAVLGDADVVDSITTHVYGDLPMHWHVLAARMRDDSVALNREMHALRTSNTPYDWLAAALAVAAYTHDLRLARRLTDSVPPVEPYETLLRWADAPLAYNAGRPSDGDRAAASMGWEGAKQHRVLMALLAVPTPPTPLLDLRRAVDAPAVPAPGAFGTRLREPDSGVPVIRDYLRGLLALTAGDTAAAEVIGLRLRAARDSGVVGALSRDLGLTLLADLRGRAGRTGEALALLDWVAPVVPFEVSHSAFYARLPARLLRGELLAAAGRCGEALPWLQGIGDQIDMVWEAAFRPRAYLAAADCLARLGRRAEARRAYESVTRMYRDAEPELQASRDSAARMALQNMR
jgi:serine/threonine-protein kinase